MKYIWKYKTPEGFDDLVMCSDGEALTGLWFDGSRDATRCGEASESRDTPVFRETCRWLDEYFAGRDPGFTPAYRIEDLTGFRSEVIDELLRIPFGATISYGDIAKAISKKHGGAKVSARAVGGAVGWNPICIIIPCHRVIGADNGLTGYGGGLSNKVSLLAHEGSDLFDARIFAPKETSDEFFLSVWRSPHVKEQRRLKRKFEKWIAADASWGEGRNEARWLGAFLSKWTVERTFTYEQLRMLTQWYLEHQLPKGRIIQTPELRNSR
jgi:methylated-DNA-[protein]-cysteine S-methyltransferase